MVNKRGQATVEAALIMPFLWIVMGLAIWAQCSLLLKAWVEHFTYEATICLVTYPNTKELCEHKLKKALRFLWPNGQLNIDSTQKKISAQTNGEFKIGPRSKVNFFHKVRLD